MGGYKGKQKRRWPFSANLTRYIKERAHGDVQQHDEYDAKDAGRDDEGQRQIIVIVPVHFTSQEISEKYDRFARWYDIVEGIPDVLGVRKLRRRLLQRASGKVLEV